MRIALIGVENRINEILDLIEQINYPLDIVPLPYQHYQQVTSLVKTLENIDGILFSGYFPYSVAREHLDDGMPAEYLEFNETCLIKLFYTEYRGEAPRLISIDTLTAPTISQIYRELDLPLDDFNVLARDKSLTVEKVAAFHEQNYRNNPQLKIITGWYSSHQLLLKAGYPSFLLRHTYFSVMGGLNRIMTAVNFKNSSANHPAVCILRIDDLPKVRKTIGNEIKVQKLIYRFMEFLLDFQEKLLSFNFESGGDRYAFPTTRKLIEDYTEQFSDFPLLYEVSTRFNFTISVGIGFGLNQMSAYGRARDALALAMQTGNTVKILTDNGQILTPLGKDHLDYRTKTFDRTTLELSEKTGIGPANISKIKNIMARLSSQHLTAYDLSKALGVTMRSGTRLMSQLHDAGYAKEAGMEQPSRGRPRKIYKILL